MQSKIWLFGSPDRPYWQALTYYHERTLRQNVRKVFVVGGTEPGILSSELFELRLEPTKAAAVTSDDLAMVREAGEWVG